MPKSDNSGCEYKTCEDLTSNCNEFYTGNDDQICTLNSSGKKCEIKSCSSLTENCGQLIPFSSYLKCELIKEGQCGILYKKCEEFTNDACDEFSGNDENVQCLLDSETNKCKQITCDELKFNECYKFKIYDKDKVCELFRDKCKIQSCSDFDFFTCETVEFSRPAHKCIKLDSGCTFTTCYETDPSDCSKFIPVNTAYKCTLNSSGDQCQIKRKECGEFSKDECTLFNIEENLEETNGKFCLEKDGKCELKSNKQKNLEFQSFILLMLCLLV